MKRMTKAEENIKIFYETLKVQYTKEARVYTEEELREALNNKNQKIQVIWSTNTVASILQYASDNKKIAALNFADPYQPGGLVFEGADTQEECLCRCSTLYHSLTAFDEDFYKYNMKQKHTTNRIIYSSDVLFFRDSHFRFTKPCYCDIITCAAPLSKENLTDQEIKERMKGILVSAMLHDVKVLILGRWGCGVFGNDWNHFQKLWREALIEMS